MPFVCLVRRVLVFVHGGFLDRIQANFAPPILIAYETARGKKRGMSIRYLTGDATAPITEGNKVIVHICNDIGKWGKGFVVAVSKRWPGPEEAYREAFTCPAPPQLGEVQLIDVAHDITVANIIGQHGVRSPRSKAPAPIRYPAVRQGLEKVAAFAKSRNASVHMPRIGCGLAGGSWDEIEPIIGETLVSEGVVVFVYDF